MVDVESYTQEFISLVGSYLQEKGVTRGNPVDNSGAEYENETFLISAHDWREEIPEDEAVPNFWYKKSNYQVEWYKHLGRGTYANRPMNIDEAYEMFQNCIASLQDAAVVKESFPEETFWEVDDFDDE